VFISVISGKKVLIATLLRCGEGAAFTALRASNTAGGGCATLLSGQYLSAVPAVFGGGVSRADQEPVLAPEEHRLHSRIL